MKKLISLFNGYAEWKNNIAKQKLDRITHLKQSIQKTKYFLNEIRLCVREHKFESNKEEIKFFKYLKPEICADLIVFNAHLKYIISKPTSIISFQKSFIKSKLKKLEAQKKKHIQFYIYYKQEESFLDDKYFLRGNEQLELFSSHALLFSDPEFCTSYGMRAAEVISNDLLVDFYKKELLSLNNIGKEITNNNFKKTIVNNLTWSASKTDLIELVYALKFSGALNGGMVQVKQIIEVVETLFEIDLGNFYKTYSEIKNRNKDRAKFLNKLADSLVARLEQDDSL
jgi:hypothetical protein